MKTAQHRMQPQPKLALVQRFLQLVVFFQTQLLQRKKLVRAGAQLAVAASGQTGNGEFAAVGLRSWRWVGFETPVDARVFNYKFLIVLP